MGNNAGQNITVGGSNSAFGDSAGITVASFGNTTLGAASGGQVTGGQNVAVGFQTGNAVTGAKNAAIGPQSGQNVNGSGNFSGGSAAGNNVTGNRNIAIGGNAGSNVSASDGISIGSNAVAGFDNSAAFGTGVTTTRANQQSFGTATNTYTFAGLPSAASTAAQGAVVGIVTTDANGNIASDGGALQTQVNTVQTTANGALQRTGGTMTGGINMGGNAITNLAAPVAAGDAANKGYVDTQVASLTGTTGSLQSQINALGQDDSKLASGIAVAVAMAGAPTLLPWEKFAMTGDLGNYDGKTAVGFNGAVKVNQNLSFNAGFGVGVNDGQIASRAGFRIGF